MLATIAVSLLGLLLLGLVNGRAFGDPVHLLCTLSAIVLVVFRLRDEARLESSTGTALPTPSGGRFSPHGIEIRPGGITPA